MEALSSAWSHRSRRVLDLFLAVTLLIAVLQLVTLAGYDGGRWRVLTSGAVLIAIVGLWSLVRTERATGRRVATLALMVLVAALPFLLDGPAAWPIFLFGLLIFVPVWGAAAGVAIVVALGVIQLVVFLVVGRGWADGLVQSASSMLIFGCGVVAGWLVAEHDRQRREIATLLAAREQDFEREAELMLSRERTRAARDLHDGLGHRLTLLSMSLQFARQARDSQPGRAWEQVDQAQTLARQALEHMRRWVRALTPPPDGSGDPLEQIADAFRSTGLTVRVNAKGDESTLDAAHRLYLRRLVQEGLTNCLRHTRASVVRIDRVTDAEDVRITVQDDGGVGDGFEEGFGLRTLRERAGELGGDFHAGWGADGFSIAATLPSRVEDRPVETVADAAGVAR